MSLYKGTKLIAGIPKNVRISSSGVTDGVNTYNAADKATPAQITTAVNNHNSSNQAHSDIRNAINAKASINDSSTTSTTQTWSAKMIHDNTPQIIFYWGE